MANAHEPEVPGTNQTISLFDFMNRDIIFQGIDKVREIGVHKHKLLHLKRGSNE